MEQAAAEKDRLRLLGSLIAASPHNLVSAKDREDVLGMHIAECVLLVDVLPVKDGSTWIDVGTGGGLPGLVLALKRPRSRWLLIDATAKKIAAVQSFAVALGLANVQAMHGRAEALARDPQLREHFDGAVSRAVGPLPVVLELSRGFVKAGGVIAAVRGPQGPDEMAAATNALAELRLRDIHRREILGSRRKTWLVSMHADGSAPRRYPRGNGVPRQRPL